MHAFVILSVIAVAAAGRLGYNYQQGVSGSIDFISSGSGINSVLALGNRNAGFGGHTQGSSISHGLTGGSGLIGGQSFGSSGLIIRSGSGVGGGLGSGNNYGSSGSVGGGVSYEQGTNRVIDGGLSKEYFIFSAPEEPVQQGHNTQSTKTYLKKNLRIIFIKAPENNGIHNTALQIAKQATEDRTAIYVLSKEPDVSEIATQVEQISENVRAKPEVRFIKFRTPQDVLNAQGTIQQQYEALGGSSQSSNEGVAPVLNFASPAASTSAASAHSHGSNLVASGSSIGSSFGNILASSNDVAVKSENKYLPPAVRK